MGEIKKIAFIGIGNMGREMCGHLLNSGKYDVTVHDAFPVQLERLTAKFPKPKWADSPAEAVKDADMILMSLNGPKDVRQVVFGTAMEGSFAGADKAKPGVLEGAKKGALLADLSTVNPGTNKEVGEACAKAGLDFVGAPVSGGMAGIKNRTLSVLGGCQTPAMFDRARPVFEDMGGQPSRVINCGGPGNGSVGKLMNNQLAFINMMSGIETVVAGTKAGMDPMVLLDVVKASSGSSGAWEGAVRMATTAPREGRTPAFPIDLMDKDITLAQELAFEVGVPMRVGATVKGILDGFKVDGRGGEDLGRPITEFLEKVSNFKVTGMWKDKPKKSKL